MEGRSCLESDAIPSQHIHWRSCRAAGGEWTSFPTSCTVLRTLPWARDNLQNNNMEVRTASFQPTLTCWLRVWNLCRSKKSDFRNFPRIFQDVFHRKNETKSSVFRTLCVCVCSLFIFIFLHSASKISHWWLKTFTDPRHHVNRVSNCTDRRRAPCFWRWTAQCRRQKPRLRPRQKAMSSARELSSRSGDCTHSVSKRQETGTLLKILTRAWHKKNWFRNMQQQEETNKSPLLSFCDTGKTSWSLNNFSARRHLPASCPASMLRPGKSMDILETENVLPARKQSRPFAHIDNWHDMHIFLFWNFSFFSNRLFSSNQEFLLLQRVATHFVRSREEDEEPNVHGWHTQPRWDTCSIRQRSRT